jgi:hypothetical protein
MEIGIQTSAVHQYTNPRHERLQTQTIDTIFTVAKQLRQESQVLHHVVYARRSSIYSSSFHFVRNGVPSTTIDSTKPKVFVIGLSKTGTTSLVCIVPTYSNWSQLTLKF